MPKRITLDMFGIENIILHRKSVRSPSGETDGNGNAILEEIQKWNISINYTMRSSDPDEKFSQGSVETYILSDAQQDKLEVLLKPYVKNLKEKVDIQTGEEWADGV